jgi:hypothetical protein
VTVRERLSAIQRRVIAGAVTPKDASEIELQLSALLGNIQAAVREADIAFNEELMRCFQSEEKANRARIRAETSEAYKQKREAKDAHALAIELIRSLRSMQRMYSEEMRLQR